MATSFFRFGGLVLPCLVGLAFLPAGSLAGQGPLALAKKGKPFPARAAAKPIVFFYPHSNQRIEKAISRGVAYLKKADDFRLGGRALAGLTLLTCGVKAKDPAVVRLARSVRAGLPQLTASYELALCLLFLDKLGNANDKKWIRRIALQLMAGQGNLGGWNYQCQVLDRGQEKMLLKLLKAPVKPGQGVFVPGPPGDLKSLPCVLFRPGQELRWGPSGWEDNSITQFAVLALWRARAHGIAVDRSLAMIEARFRASQFLDGSWAYKWNPLKGAFRADSMTCSGLLGLAVARGISPGFQGGDPAIEKALSFLGKRIGGPGLQKVLVEKVNANNRLMLLQQQLKVAPFPQRPAIIKEIQDLLKEKDSTQVGGTILGANARGDLYFLWSLERVAMTYDLRTIGGKDWYSWGVPLVLAHQYPDGSWQDLFPGVPDTCFALFFLNRTNVVQDLTRQLLDLPLSRDAGGRLADPLQGMSPGERARLARPKGR